MDISELMQNFRNVKGQVSEISERLAKMRISGDSGAGMVKVVLDGEGMIKDIKIDKELLSPENKEMLEELIISAVNETSAKAKISMANEMKQFTKFANIPGLDSLLNL